MVAATTITILIRIGAWCNGISSSATKLNANGKHTLKKDPHLTNPQKIYKNMEHLLSTGFFPAAVSLGGNFVLDVSNVTSILLCIHVLLELPNV